MRRPLAMLAVPLLLALACDKQSTAEPTAATPVPAEEAAPANEGPEMTLTGVLSEDEFKKLHELSKAQAPAPRGETIDLAGSRAYLSLPGGNGPFPGVIVIHEWWGLNDNIRHWSDRLAAAGYAALAVDLYEGKVATTPDEATTYMKGSDPEKGKAIIAAAHELLASDERIRAPKRGVIGWCFGGGWSLQTAIALADLDAAVIYYGRLETDPKALEPIEARLLGIFGNQDKGIPPEAVDAFEKALEEAGKQATILRYDANHAFANPSSARYDHENAAKAWAETRKFLDANLGGG